jgi:NAD+ synthase (glutamine-hydrolysing)
MAGGFAPLKDVYKTLVYRLARYRNSLRPDIPERVFQKPPSAELRPGQKDQDTLPPYQVLDQILMLYIEEGLSKEEIVSKGMDGETVEKVIRMIRLAEYKRSQAPVGTKITPRAFGKDWRMPITNMWGY